MRWGQAGIWLVGLGTLAPSGAARAALRGGAAKVAITPPTDIGPVSLGGYGDRQGAQYAGVHDDIFARALALQQADGAGCVIVALDRLEVPQYLHADVCAALAAAPALEFPVGPDNLVITASHTHSAPENLARQGDLFPLAFGQLNQALYDWTVRQIDSVVRDAVSRLRPAAVGAVEVGLEGLVANRRGGAAVYPVLTALWVTEPDGRPIAVLTNFAAHPTMLGPENLLISGDWPGELERQVEQTLGGDAVCLFTNGAQGDQRPAGDFGASFEGVAAYGRRLADAVLATRAEVHPSPDAVVRTVSEELTLPQRTASPAFAASASQEYPIPPDQLTAVLGALFPARARVHAVRLGDALIVTVPGEMAADLGAGLRARAGPAAKHPFIAGLANTYCGYILSPAEYDRGGYEAAISVYGRDFGPWLVDALARLMSTADAP